MKTYICTASALKLRALPDGPDTGRRIIRGQVVEGHGESYDGDWLYVTAPGGAGWAAAPYLTASAAVLPSPAWPVVPDGYDGLVRTFGEPCSMEATAGRVVLPASLPAAWDAGIEIRKFSCHALLAPVLQSVLGEIARRGFWDRLEDFGGCYACRTKRTTSSRPSVHSWGAALDLSAASNPLGAPPRQDPAVVAIFEDHGFIWGGRWSRPDGMHFQYATGY